ncbi:hypothetical protein CRYUN_Cryun25bG0018500 [Craigia yunnanensis]
MAKSIFRSDNQSNTFPVLGLFCFMLLMIQKGYAREFVVNWGLHNGTTAKNYDQWAEKNRFQIGDSIVFIYTPNDDSVLHVTAEDYKNCNVESPISKYTDGRTVYPFIQTGPYYFISGNQEHCQKNEKLVVVVLANHSSSTNETSPLSPPSGSIEESNPPNAASSVFMSVTASIGAFVASTVVLAF